MRTTSGSAPGVVRPEAGHRRPGTRGTPTRWRLRWTKTLSFGVAAATAVVVASVSALGGVIAFDTLRHLVSPSDSRGLADWWPLLVYGPWMVASLSVLRAALYRRRAPHSWAVVLFFSAFAVLLCVAHAPRTLIGTGVAGLPAVAAVACFHQLVRQITLTRPPSRAVTGHHGMPRPAQR